MLFLFIVGVSLVQIVFYYLNDKYKTKLPNLIVLIVFLLGHFFLFPRLFYPEQDPNSVNCAMPLLGINIAFWVLGTIAALAAHLIWVLIRKKTRKNLNKRKSPLL